jgi:hypothetical protein
MHCGKHKMEPTNQPKKCDSTYIGALVELGVVAF